jgi:hypothetical protein
METKFDLFVEDIRPHINDFFLYKIEYEIPDEVKLNFQKKVEEIFKNLKSIFPLLVVNTPWEFKVHYRFKTHSILDQLIKEFFNQFEFIKANIISSSYGAISKPENQNLNLSQLKIDELFNKFLIDEEINCYIETENVYESANRLFKKVVIVNEINDENEKEIFCFERDLDLLEEKMLSLFLKSLSIKSYKKKSIEIAFTPKKV